jgi:hypothetical protein
MVPRDSRSWTRRAAAGTSPGAAEVRDDDPLEAPLGAELREAKHRVPRATRLSTNAGIHAANPLPADWARLLSKLREALDNGWRLVPDEPLQWFRALIREYPPFQELVRIR